FLQARFAVEEFVIQQRLARDEGHVPSFDEKVEDVGCGLERITVANKKGCILAGFQRTEFVGNAENLGRDNRYGTQRLFFSKSIGCGHASIVWKVADVIGFIRS